MSNNTSDVSNSWTFKRLIPYENGQTLNLLNMATLNDLLKTGTNISVTINILDLKEWMLELIQEVKDKTTIQTNEVYKTPEETANMLQVNKSTLWRWAKQGYLVPIKWGGKTRYKLSDIKNCMEG